MNRLTVLFLTATLLLGLHAKADIVVIANQDLTLEQLNKKQIINIYMGRSSSFPNGQTAIPLDLPLDSEGRVEFYQKLIRKSLNEINSYWARLLFSGRATPPRAMNNAQEVIELVSSNPAAIGYIPKSELPTNANIKIIGTLE